MALLAKLQKAGFTAFTIIINVLPSNNTVNDVNEVMPVNADKGPPATSIQILGQSRQAVRSLLKLSFKQIENAKFDPEALPPIRGLFRPKDSRLFRQRRLSPRLSRL